MLPKFCYCGKFSQQFKFIFISCIHMANSGLGISPLLHLGHVVLGDGKLDHESLVSCEVAAIVTHRRCDRSDVLNRAGNKPSRSYTITEKAPTILRHYAEQGLTKVNQCTVGQISQFCPMGVLGLFIL